MRAAFGTEVEEKLKPRLTAWEVVKRVAIGVYNDGFIHAGNLAYLSIVALFPFFIVAAAVAHLLGQSQDAHADRDQRPPAAPARCRSDAARADPRSADRRAPGPLLWLGALVGLWTATSFIETIRDILRRAYGVKYLRALLGISARLDPADPRRGAAADDRVRGERRADARRTMCIIEWFPFAAGHRDTLGLYRLVLAATLFFTFYVLFYALTPARYRKHGLPEMAGRLAHHRLVARRRSSSCRTCSACSAATAGPTAASPA